MQAQLRTHSENMTDLQAKLDNLSLQLTTKEQALITAKLTLEHAQTDLTRKRAQLEALEDTQKGDVNRLEGKNGTLRDDC